MLPLSLVCFYEKREEVDREFITVIYSVSFFEPPSSSFQGGIHISHQASLLPEERGCNRPPVLGTASL